MKHLASHGWVSDPATFPPNIRDTFNAIETRLRKFEELPYWRSGDPR
jgi:hypothetical protein